MDFPAVNSSLWTSRGWLPPETISSAWIAGTTEIPRSNPIAITTLRCFIDMFLQRLSLVTKSPTLKFHRPHGRALDHLHGHCLDIRCRITDRLRIELEKVQDLFRRIGLRESQNLMQSSLARDGSGNRHMIVCAFEMQIGLIRQQLRQMLLQPHEIDADIKVEDGNHLIFSAPNGQICRTVALPCDIDLFWAEYNRV